MKEEALVKISDLKKPETNTGVPDYSFPSATWIDYSYSEYITNAFEVPYIRKDFENTTAHELYDIIDFSYAAERIDENI